MAEQEPRKVEPKYSVEFHDSETFHRQQREGLSPQGHYYPIPFRDRNSGQRRLAVVSSGDSQLVSEVSSTVLFGDRPVTEDEVRDMVQKYSTRYPVANSYSGKIVCQEPSCVSYDNGSCTNSNVRLEDGECAINSYCLTYEPKR